jgi:protein SCO1/2
MRVTPALALVILLLAPRAHAALTQAEIDAAKLSLPAHAIFPLTLSAPDTDGRLLTLKQALGARGGFILFADFTCRTLCGPALALLGQAAERSGLARDSYRIVVFGIDPKDTAADAKAMLASQLPQSLRANAVFLLPDAATLHAATTAVGFHYVYDKSIDQFAHPELAFAVAPDGRVLRLLPPFALTTADLKSALLPDTPQTHGLYDQIVLLCYRLGALHGVYDGSVQSALKVGGFATILFLGLGFALLLARVRRGSAR